ncbi:DUF1613-domain-containing protein [Coniophora puteana RWD-64-598 SS2]|uniref:tRNA (uracil-O(2)-)-methyltransferase n=1 Tax=Coniophora puteana (strain RWD-64-598) TaxID=741705 RepID=A0A5M3MDX2_CONPW|nr:DUF1613-domain-containing protein [Coniophora puteana RWD-64-598 SS2]EIW77428.1 DUF1613-domain-containing protein [Coniophora puteana RWD-64-598 SS2]
MDPDDQLFGRLPRGTPISQLVHHPEYNSTLILRSETVSESTPGDASFPSFEFVLPLDGLRAVRNVHRRLLPRRPGRDKGLEQHCTLYAFDNDQREEGIEGVPCALVLSPIVKPGEELPYYHPTVSHLAFRFVPNSSQSPSEHPHDASSESMTPPPEPPISPEATLRIDVLPLPGTPRDPNSRLYRTCLALLETLHRYGWGALTSYKKRVRHDVLVPRETYQDAYLALRTRHAHLVGEWREATDPLKHVFEDIGIATFLMLLWKGTFQDHSSSPSGAKPASPPPPPPDAVAPWRSWPRPPGGFVDLGCGNGLLTHILTSESYTGVGVDLRARTSWEHYPPSTRAQLRVRALDPTAYLRRSSDSDLDPSDRNNAEETRRLLPEGAFLIGNHADELTPWLPVLATLSGASGYASIPCCAWTFDVRFSRGASANRFAPEVDEREVDEECAHPDAVVLPPGEQDRAMDFVEKLNLGGDGSTSSSYSAYRVWLARLSVWLGWAVECEILRIPSTRNWALIGRRRIRREDRDESVYRARALAIIEGVVQRGTFKTRKPEGKAGDH